MMAIDRAGTDGLGAVCARSTREPRAVRLNEQRQEGLNRNTIYRYERRYRALQYCTLPLVYR